MYGNEVLTVEGDGEQQIKLLADYILTEIPGEPSRSEGAGDCAIRIMKHYRNAMSYALAELGIPDDTYPAPIARAYDILKEALLGRLTTV